MSEVPSIPPSANERYLTYDEIRDMIREQRDQEMRIMRPHNFRTTLQALRTDKVSMSQSKNAMQREKWENLMVNLEGLANGIDYEQIWQSHFPGWNQKDFQALLDELDNGSDKR